MTRTTFCLSPGDLVYQFLGCFDDKKGDRALRELLENRRGEIDWPNTYKTSQLKSFLDSCANEAKGENYNYFALQFYGECYSDTDTWASANYNKHGPSSEFVTDLSGTYYAGGANTNCVYQLVQ